MYRLSACTIFFAGIVSLSANHFTSVAASSADALEAARFGPLPPTVFAPGGRLHGVERVAREAYPSGDDESSCAVIALRCGSKSAAGGEFAIMSGIGAISPFLHRALVMDYLTPISLISPNVIVGVGGKGIDSAVLLRRASEVSLSMYKSDNGGVEWFISHSLEGVGGNSHSIPVGGAARVDAKTLARRIADMAQSSTQSLGGKSGQMLSVS